MATQSTLSIRRPTAILRELSVEEKALRFWHIGGREQFMLLLQRFRSEFPLARSHKINGLDWIVFASSQYEAVIDFCQRYGLFIVKEHS